MTETGGQVVKEKDLEMSTRIPGKSEVEKVS